MFNDDRKRWFIKDSDYIVSTIEIIERLFNSTEPIERQKKKDLCEFSQKDVIDLLRSFNSKSRRTLESKCNYLFNYYNWCLNKGFTEDIENVFVLSSLKNVIEDLVPVNILSDKIFLFDDIDEMINDIPQVEYKLYIYSIFCGLNIDDLIHLRMSDYNNKTNELKLYSGRTIKPDKLLYNLMWQTDSMEYFDKDGTGSCIEGRYKFRYMYVKTEYVLKAAGSKSCSYDYISKSVYDNGIRYIQKYFNNKNISYVNLHKSGLINFIKEKYEEKGISIQDVFTKKINDRVYEHDSETQDYIYEFGEKITTRMLRMEIIDIIDRL